MLRIVADEHDHEGMEVDLDAICRSGAKRMLRTALRAEVTEYIEAARGEVDEQGHALVVRNGTARARAVTTSSGAIEVEAPRVEDRREGARFTSAILPPWARRSPGQLVTKGKDINRRLLAMERAAQHCTPAASVFETIVLPTGDPDHRAPGLRFGDPRVVGIFASLSQFNWLMAGFRAKDLRPLVEHHLARPYTIGQMGYDLRRLHRKGLIERVPKTYRYQLTKLGRQIVLFFTKLYNRVVCRGLARLHPEQLPNPLRVAWNRFDTQVDHLIEDARLAA